jgi:hypothetical protein
MMTETHKRLLRGVLESNRACAELLKEKNVTQGQINTISNVLISNNGIIQTLLNVEELNNG